MSMSSKIEDLPGQEEINNEPHIPQQQQHYQQQEQQHYEQPVDTSFVINKKYINQDFFSQIKNEFNKEKFLLFVLFYINTYPELNDFIRENLFKFGGITGLSLNYITIIKSFLMVVIFVISSMYLL